MRSAPSHCSSGRLKAALKPPTVLREQCLHGQTEKPKHCLSSPRRQHGDPKARRPASSAFLALPSLRGARGTEKWTGTESVRRGPQTAPAPRPAETLALSSRTPAAALEAFNYRGPQGGQAAPPGQAGTSPIVPGLQLPPLPCHTHIPGPSASRLDTPGPASLLASGHGDTPCAPLPVRPRGTLSFAASAWWVEERPRVGSKGTSRSLRVIEAWLGLPSLCAGSGLSPPGPWQGPGEALPQTPSA